MPVYTERMDEMKITTELIWDNLSSEMEAQYYGAQKHTALCRPKLYNPKYQPEEKQVYITTADMLPAIPVFSKNMLLICAGGRPDWNYTKGNFPFIWVKNENMLDVFNYVQDLFGRYETWFQRITKIVNTSADIVEIVRLSLPVFGNPIEVADSSLHYLAKTEWVRDVNNKCVIKGVHIPEESMAVDEAKTVWSQYYANQKHTEPYRHDETQYCVNLFVKDTFEGSIGLLECMRTVMPSDLLLLDCMARMIEAAIQKQGKILTAQTATLKNVVFDLLNCCPVSDHRIQQTLSKKISSSNCRFICFKLKTADNIHKLPTDYICDNLESLLPGSISMEFESVIVNVLDLTVFPYPYEEFIRILEQYLGEMGFQAGISNDFNDIRTVRHHFRQACCAIETGAELGENRLTYRFGDYALYYMLMRSRGEFSIKYICPRGVLALREYSLSASVDYWNTLRVYLRNNLNAAQTAKELYLHRSTFLQRLERINQLLELNLKDPEQQLWLRMCVRLLDMDEYFNH